MESTNSSILSLARSILHSSEQIVTYLEQQKCTAPSFNLSTDDLPSSREYETLSTGLSEAATDLIRLVNGPKHYYRQMMLSHCDLAALQSAIGLGLFENIPENGTSLVELASVIGVQEERIGQVMRFLASQRVFQESEEGFFQHTPTSLIAARDEDVRMLLGLEDVSKASSELSEWIRASPWTSSNEDCSFTHRYGMPLFKYLDQNPAKATRFARGMGGAARFDRQTREIFTEYPWETIQDGKVVDIGGGSGHVSMQLAEQFPNLQVVVQDKSPNMLAQGPKLDVYSHVKDRVTFLQYDFFTPQPVCDADAFILRQITHNWNDGSLIKMLRALVPALEKCRPGTPLLINDTILPELGAVTRFEEHSLRQLDVLMLVLLGAKQRTEKQFRKVLKAADDRFEVVKVSSEGPMGLIEVHLKADMDKAINARESENGKGQ